MTEVLSKHIRRAKRGKAKSQEYIYTHFYRYAMSVSMRYSAKLEEAEEIVNNAFIKVFSKLDSFEESRDFKPWLRRIVINSSIDYQRKNTIFLEELTEEKQAEQVFDNTILERLSAEEILKAVMKLTPAYRTVFTLYAIEEFTHKEIADELKISIGTSKSNLAKARVKLQEELERMNQPF